MARQARGRTEFVIGESGKLYLAAILDLILSVRRRLGGEREHVQVDACIARLVHR